MYAFFLLFFTIRIHAALLLPEDLEIQNVFFPGKGKPIGKVRIVQGTAYMMHDTVLKGYLITENMPIYGYVPSQKQSCHFHRDKGQHHPDTS
jgi:hypothetical protein